MALHDKKAVAAFKHETTTGTAISLAAADGTINVFNMRVFDATEFIERQGQASPHRIAGAIGMRVGQCTFQTDFVPGSAAHPAWASRLLPACGWGASTNTYTPRTQHPTGSGTTVKTLTLAKYTDGIYEQLHGAMGTFRMMFVAGRTCIIDWTFTGVYTDAQDVAVIEPTYETTAALRWVSSTLTVGSYTPKVESLVFDAGNDVMVLPDSRTTTGAAHAVIRDRRPTITMNPETSLVASVPYQTDWRTPTARQIDWVISNGTIGAAFQAPAAQHMAPPSPSERGSVRTDELSFLCLGSGQGDNEANIVFDIS